MNGIIVSVMSAVLEGLTPMNKDNVLKSLDIMWKGVLAIFVTIAIVTLVSVGINYVCNRAKAAVEKKRKEIQENSGSDQNKQQ